MMTPMDKSAIAVYELKQPKPVEFFIPPRFILYLIFFYVRKESAPDGSQHRMGVSTGKTQHRIRVSKKWKVVIVAGESAT